MATVKKMLYQQLTAFLLTKLPKRYHGNFYSWIEDGKLVNQGKQVTNNGIEICHIQYDGILFFNEFPFKEISPAYLMALMQIWLNENDDMRDCLDNYETPFDIEIINDDVADMSFTISFQEPLTAIEDDNGELEIEGERYTLSAIEIFTADEINIDVVIDDSNSN